MAKTISFSDDFRGDFRLTGLFNLPSSDVGFGPTQDLDDTTVIRLASEQFVAATQEEYAGPNCAGGTLCVSPYNVRHVRRPQAQ